MTIRHLLFWSLVAAGSLTAAQSYGFGTVKIAGQNAEHERITRHALQCERGRAKGTCFEKDTLDMLAGKSGDFGAVGTPDRGALIFEPKAHCDAGDHLDAPGYPQSEADARKKMEECRRWMSDKLDEAVRDAAKLLDDKGRIRGSEIPTLIACQFVGREKGRAKCNVLEDFGILLHAAQDFYSHTNWTDRPDPARPVDADNPPGLGNDGPAAWLNLRGPAPNFPKGLISGCFETKSAVNEAAACNYGPGDKTHRVKHGALNKDEGVIDPKIAGGKTVRGKVEGNFARAVNAAIADTQDKWATLGERLIATYGPERGAKMICALTRDDPEDDCK